MLPAIDYLEFAGRYFGRSEHELATSGIAPILPETLGDAPAVADFGARPRFAAALAERYGVATAEALPCLGASGALYVVSAALLEPGDEVLVESPAYEPLWRVPQGLGAALRRFERVRGDAYAIDPERVIAALTPRTRLVIVTNPHNPTGVVTAEPALLELARALEARGVLLLVDEVYLELVAPKSTARRLAPNVIACSSATKCWGLPWARAGWLLGPSALVERFGHVERHVIGMAPPACWAWGERALSMAEQLLSRAHELQRGKRARVDAFMVRAAELFDWQPPPDASLFGWVEARPGVPLVARLEQARTRHGVLVAPGSFFGNDAAFRLGWVSPLSGLDAALSSLERALCVDSGPLP